MVKKQDQLKQGLAYLEENFMTPSKENATILAQIDEEPARDKMSFQKIVARKSFTLDKLDKLVPQTKTMLLEAKEQIIIEAKYKNYIEKQKEQIDRMKSMMDVKIPEFMDFTSIGGLSNEVVEKLQRFNPPTLFAASEISGITPAAIDILHIYIKIQEKKR